jgi:hypothetical protein
VVRVLAEVELLQKDIKEHNQEQDTAEKLVSKEVRCQSKDVCLNVDLKTATG